MEPPPISPDLLAGLSPPVVAFIRALVAENTRLAARLAELEARLASTPANSSKPPSSVHPHAKPARPASGGKRKPGGQPGHAKSARDLVAPGECDEVIDCLPDACRRCSRPLAGTDADPLRHQVWEMPEIKPRVTEYRRHRLVCSCGCSTCGPLPAGVPGGQAGPRLVAFSGLLMACFRQSKRRAAQFLGMVLGQPASAAWMVSLQGRAADAAGAACDELAAKLPDEPVLHVDESPTKQGKARAWVWTFVAASFTYFACRTSRAGEVPRGLLGEDYAGVVCCDRARMYWAFGRLQWCWAHLKRDFQGLIDSGCGTRRRLGHDLMRQASAMFDLWHLFRAGGIAREELQRRLEPIREKAEGYLLRGYFNRLTHGFCKELWEHRARLWTFAAVGDAEPTNNAAERALRHAVIWRKLSFGTQSAAGSRFAERLLTVIETCRRQKKDVFAWLTEAVRARFACRPGPSLLFGA